MPAPPRLRPAPGLSGAPKGPPTHQSPEPVFLQPELLEEDVVVLPKRRSLWPLTIVVLITGLALVIAVAAATASGPSVQNSAPMAPFEPAVQTPVARPQSPVADPSRVTRPTQSIEAPTPAPSFPQAAPAVTPPAPSAEATRGTLELPPWTKGHRIYLNGHVVGEGPGPLQVRCGPHLVRLGSAGRELSVAVPCGGEMRVR